MTRTRKHQVWFVQCPQTKKWHFGLHPHIYHKCPDCGGAVHYEKDDDATHTLRRAEFRVPNARAYARVLDEVIAEPEKYLVAEPGESKRGHRD